MLFRSQILHQLQRVMVIRLHQLQYQIPLVHLHLGKVLNETGRSGYATYQKVAFDLARLAELDPEGVAEHCKFAGIEVPKEKPQKTKKQNRGEER